MNATRKPPKPPTIPPPPRQRRTSESGLLPMLPSGFEWLLEQIDRLDHHQLLRVQSRVGRRLQSVFGIEDGGDCEADFSDLSS